MLAKVLSSTVMGDSLISMLVFDVFADHVDTTFFDDGNHDGDG